MNEAEKRVVKAEAYLEAYNAIEFKIGNFIQLIEWNTENINQSKADGFEIADDDYRVLENIKLTEKIEVYKQVEKEIMK